MDLSKAFDTINSDLLIAKFHAYDLQEKSLKLLRDYQSNRSQRTKVTVSYSTWDEL